MNLYQDSPGDSDDKSAEPGEAVSKPASKAIKKVLGPAMTERELIAILRAEEVDSTSYYTSELSKDQAYALDRYYAKPFGNEADGRSKISTHDVEDTVNWLMPDLMRVFLQSDDLVSITSTNPQIEETLPLIAEYIRQVAFDDNGDEWLHDMAFDGLLNRIGVVSARWQEPEPQAPEELEGVTQDQLAQFTSDPEYTILEQEERQQTIQSPVGPMQGTVYDLKVQKTPKCGRVVIEGVPPEEFAIERRAVSIARSGYHRREQQVYATDLIAEYPDHAKDLDPTIVTSTTKDIELNSDPRTIARFQQESVTTNRETSNYEKRKKVNLYTEYIRIDYDNDGTVELRQIKRVGDTILENERVEESEFATWTPIRVSHKLVGRSVVDPIMDIQRIRTEVTRRMLDSLDQSLMPRTAYDKSRLDPEDIDALIDAEVGGVIGCQGPPGDVLLPVVTPDLTAAGLTQLEYWDRMGEQATGVSRDAHSMAPNAKTETMGGLELLSDAAGDRTELVARWLAKGVESLLQKVLNLLVAYQDGPRMVKLFGKPVEMNPSLWKGVAGKGEMVVKVHVAMAAASRQTMLQNLALIAGKQEQIMLQAGPDNPLCGPKEYGHTLSRMVETMGYRDSSKFFKDVSNYQAQPQQPKPDPKMLEVQQQGQIAQAKLQQDGQIKSQQLQLDKQSAQQKQLLDQQGAQAAVTLKQQVAAHNAQLDREVAFAKMQSELELSQRKMEGELALAATKIQGELQLAREKQEHDIRITSEKHQNDMQVQRAKVNLADDDSMSTPRVSGGSGTGNI